MPFVIISASSVKYMLIVPKLIIKMYSVTDNNTILIITDF
jgi:hypothetical protein